MMRLAKTKQEAIEHLRTGGILVAMSVDDGLLPIEKRMDFYQVKATDPLDRQKEAEHIVDIVLFLNACGEARAYLANIEPINVPKPDQQGTPADKDNNVA